VPIKPGILYQPHPAFAVDAQGRHVYHSMKPGELGDRRSPWQFEQLGTRELVADDFVYAIKRHATTRITTPIYGIFAEYVLGLKEYGDTIKAEDAKLRAGLSPASLDKPFLDFRRWPLAGATAPEKHLLRIRIKGKYPQWNYWMAMTFLSPLPWEADAFYAQPGMVFHGLSLDRWPVGTGPYMMAEYVQDRRLVMKRNPNYRGEPYPCEGMPGDKEAGLLDDCGKTMPFIDSLVSTIEKEGVPLRAKFRQGYYDIPRIERFDDGMEFLVEMDDSPEVRRDYIARGFQLPKFADVSVNYLGFNMLDPTVGRGATPEQHERNRKLRQAISIAVDWEEYSRIFPKNAGEVAMSPLPAGLFGSRHGQPEGLNPVTHTLQSGKPQRRSIAEAKQLMVEAGYPDGFALTLHGPNDRYVNDEGIAQALAQMWARIGVRVNVATMPSSMFFARTPRDENSMALTGWSSSTGEADTSLINMVATPMPERGWGTVVRASHYSNPETDDLLLRALSTLEPEARGALYRQIIRLGVQRDLAVIPIHHQVNIWATRANVRYAPQIWERTRAMEFTPVQ
jgi:ABC-type transport system substrate-binding protein